MEYITKDAPSNSIRIWIAGDYDDAVRSLRGFTSAEGSCFTVKRCAYVYTHGMEDGVEVTIINYPRFPHSKEYLSDQAHRLAKYLADELHQGSFTVEESDISTFYSRRAVDKKEN